MSNENQWDWMKVSHPNPTHLEVKAHSLLGPINYNHNTYKNVENPRVWQAISRAVSYYVALEALPDLRTSKRFKFVMSELLTEMLDELYQLLAEYTVLSVEDVQLYIKNRARSGWMSNFHRLTLNREPNIKHYEDTVKMAIRKMDRDTFQLAEVAKFPWADWAEEAERSA